VRSLLTCLLLTACASRAAQNTAVLQAEIADLRARVTSLEGQVRNLASDVDMPGDPVREQEAVEIAIQARAAMDSMNMELARELVDQLVRDYPDTQLGQAAVEVAERLALIGAPAPPLRVERWFRGKGTIDPKRTTLLVFFEPWCPHCRREAPSLQARHLALRDEGLDVVGLSSFNRGTTDADMSAFLDGAGVTFPIGHEDGNLSVLYQIQGVPAAVLIHHGKIAWTGHPSEVTVEVLRSFLARP